MELSSKYTFGGPCAKNGIHFDLNINEKHWSNVLGALRGGKPLPLGPISNVNAIVPECSDGEESDLDITEIEAQTTSSKMNFGVDNP